MASRFRPILPKTPEMESNGNKENEDELTFFDKVSLLRQEIQNVGGEEIEIIKQMSKTNLAKLKKDALDLLVDQMSVSLDYISFHDFL